MRLVPESQESSSPTADNAGQRAQPSVSVGDLTTHNIAILNIHPLAPLTYNWGPEWCFDFLSAASDNLLKQLQQQDMPRLFSLMAAAEEDEAGWISAGQDVLAKNYPDVNLARVVTPILTGERARWDLCHYGWVAGRTLKKLRARALKWGLARQSEDRLRLGLPLERD